MAFILPEPERISALILAGGRGSRMDDADKGLVLFRDRPLVLHALEKLAPVSSECLISANRNLAMYAGFGCSIVQDQTGDFHGPLAGVAAGLSVCRTPWMLTAPCDVPLFPSNLSARLSEAVSEKQARLAVAVAGGELQGVFMLMDVKLEPQLREYLASGRRSVQGWIGSLEQAGVAVVRVMFEPAHPDFSNLNTLAELDALENLKP